MPLVVKRSWGQLEQSIGAEDEEDSATGTGGAGTGSEAVAGDNGVWGS